MKKIVLFKKRKALLNRITELEIEVGIEKEPDETGLIGFIYFGGGYHSRLYKSVGKAAERIGKLENGLNDLRKYLDVSYQKESTTLVKKQEPEVKQKDWKDKIADAIEEAVEESNY